MQLYWQLPKFGETILGVINYDKKSQNKLELAQINKTEIDKSKVRINSTYNKLSLAKTKILKYKGLNIEDIWRIEFHPHTREPERYESGEKKVPNVINIETDFETDFSGIDIDVLTQNYLLSKNNSGTNLILFEKEQLVGITMAFNGRIDSRILAHLGFSKKDLKENLNIWNYLYRVKERRKQLTEQDKQKYSELKQILSMNLQLKFLKELKEANYFKSESKSTKSTIKEVFLAIENFTPSILFQHGDNQVFWDVDSYIHIAMRHIKEYQVANYKKKTPLLYKSDELGLLIEKILTSIKEEINFYFLQGKEKDFTRHGSMNVYFNGDHLLFTNK